MQRPEERKGLVASRNFKKLSVTGAYYPNWELMVWDEAGERDRAL